MSAWINPVLFTSLITLKYYHFLCKSFPNIKISLLYRFRFQIKQLITIQYFFIWHFWKFLFLIELTVNKNAHLCYIRHCHSYHKLNMLKIILNLNIRYSINYEKNFTSNLFDHIHIMSYMICQINVWTEMPIIFLSQLKVGRVYFSFV